MTTTTDHPADAPTPAAKTPGQPYDVFQPNGGQPLAPATVARNRATAKLEAQLEDQFRRCIMGLLRGRTIKLAPTEKGAPDRLVILPGGAMHLVELKTETGRLSPAQRLWHDRAGKLGVQVHVLYGEEQMLRWVASAQNKN